MIYPSFRITLKSLLPSHEAKSTKREKEKDSTFVELCIYPSQLSWEGSRRLETGH